MSAAFGVDPTIAVQRQLTLPDGRDVGHAAHPLFAHRWSPRAFSSELIDEASLMCLFEAARWAPSGSNSQPWRFIYARRATAGWSGFLEFLSDNNRLWAQHAAALVLLISKTTYRRPDSPDSIPARNHSFDAGAAWASLALQATLSGWRSRAMGGFDKELARDLLGIPPEYVLHVVIAIGRQGDRAALPESLREREQPTPRRPVEQLVAEGRFSFTEP